MAMGDFETGRSDTWNIYTSLNPSQSAEVAVNGEAQGPLEGFGASMDAISFGFMATAILVSLFLIMAIFEHIFRPSPTFASPEAMPPGRSQARLPEMLWNSQRVLYGNGISVMMPGQDYPTFIAQPAPLPCHREGIHFPSHDLSYPLSVE
ncbi:hypothetical protein SAY86_019151 [Trapa natans]|uniref:Uncharacterized protein n=1 Tax=Trapa natans TaxID=22666 RepID=A0AAN7LBK2_TRANT|nr:hypothetical protein SAY86_019151 [Trapa natans]